MRNRIPTRRAGRTIFEACEPRQHLAVDLVATGMTCSDPVMPVMYHPLHYKVTVANAGTTAIPQSTGVVIALYSVDDMNDPSPTYLDSVTMWGWGALETKTIPI